MRSVLIPKILDLLALGIQVVPDLIDAGRTEVALINSGTPPTPEQQAQIDAALDAAHQALQAATPGASA